ncbi:MAG TPA: hypothetical protein VGV89_04460 [Thermoplasmata archaeon]|nr:hypothetical protein [Thermoplasmata archaeon]
MVEQGRWARFTPVVEGYESSIHEVPRGGFCLSVFLLLNARDRPSRILIGRPNPGANWERLAGYRRAGVSDEEWLLPASILRFAESPDDAAQRIIDEQLAGIQILLSGPQVESEVYSPRGRVEWKNHWDLRFLYTGALAAAPPTGSVWAELALLDPTAPGSKMLGRGQGDILRSKASVSR